MTVRLLDVALSAGVSVKTVSNVVNGYQHVSPETRRRVQAAIDELGYRPNLSARSLRQGRSGLVALALPRLDVPYFAELASATVAAAADQGWTVLVEQTDGRPEREREVLAGLRGGLIDGLVLSPMALRSEDLRAAPGGIPVVLLGERTTDAPADHVGVDNVGAACAATEHLLARGRAVAAIGYQDAGRSASGVAPLRGAGYELAMGGRGLAVRSAWTPPVTSYGRSEGAVAMGALLDLADPPDAVFCFSDTLALGALHELARRRIRVPEDVAVMGFDDIEDGRYSSPTLSTVDPGKPRIARTAVAMLADRLDDGEGAPARDVTVPFDLVPRESTLGPLRGSRRGTAASRASGRRRTSRRASPARG